MTSSFGYDKHMEHMDQTPLGKLQQQYWTTKQQVIKKLGKKEDEYVVMSDAELDAKLDVSIGKIIVLDETRRDRGPYLVNIFTVDLSLFDA